MDWLRDLHGKPQGVEPNRPLETTLAQHRYDARGRLVETWSSSPSIGAPVRTLHREYYADTAGAGSQGKLKAESSFYRPGAVFVHDGITVDLAGSMSGQGGWVYDAEGRTHIATQAGRTTFRREGGTGGEPLEPLMPALRRWRDDLTELSSTSYTYGETVKVETPTGLYTLNNAAGLLTSYAHTQSAKSWGDDSTLPAAATQTFTIDAYVATSQGWQERKVSGSSTNPSYNSTTSTLRYDAWGRRIEQEQKTQVPGPKNNLYNLSLYRYNGDGQVVTRRDFWTERDDNYAINKWWQGKIDNFTEAKPNTRFV